MQMSRGSSMLRVLCCPSVSTSLFSPLSVTTRFTSQGPAPVFPKEGTLTYKYEAFIGKWPKVLAMHRRVVDGSRWCFSDVKTYFRVRRDLAMNRRALSELSNEELEVLVQSGGELLKMSFLLVVLQIPGPGDILILLLIFFPRLILTRHFWTDEQREEFFAKEVAASHSRAADIRKVLGTNRDLNTKLPSLKELDQSDLLNLAKLHGLLPLPTPGLRNRLELRVAALKRLDHTVNFNDLTDRQILFHCYIRRLNTTNLSNSAARDALKAWAPYSQNLGETAYLSAPLMFKPKN